MKGFTARVMYRKSGLTRLIGHLDTVRVLRRAVRRAGIPGVYSQGFSPRLRLSFSPPLPLGFTSQCEFFDIQLARSPGHETFDPVSMGHSLQSQFPEGLFVEEVHVLEGDHPPLTTAFWAAAYEIELPHDCPVNREILDRISQVEGLTAGSDEPDEADRTPASRVLRAQWKEKDGGMPVLSVVLRQDASGKGGLKQIIGAVLGMSRDTLEKCRIHKKRVYANGEQV